MIYKMKSYIRIWCEYLCEYLKSIMSLINVLIIIIRDQKINQWIRDKTYIIMRRLKIIDNVLNQIILNDGAWIWLFWASEPFVSPFAFDCQLWPPFGPFGSKCSPLSLPPRLRLHWRLRSPQYHLIPSSLWTLLSV